ncbi:Defensin-like protein 68 [Labeo rohita]|uniref:Defensin-like protein 68 n=1 Tax=Labeo rohita TaxID=84645 RepID=A0ABQ8MUN8_LABRO|nr:Defensin-like protein 68 [Labeo rohita]
MCTSSECSKIKEEQGIPQRYVSGPVSKDLEGIFLRTDDEAYHDAWEKLNCLYGQPFAIQRAFSERLADWPKIRSKDAIGLRNFSDLLSACENAMPHVKGLQILNDYQENQKLVQKLPDWVASRWNRQVTQALSQNQEFPDCKEFCAFVDYESGNFIDLPPAYTRDYIPVNRDHIPTCEVIVEKDDETFAVQTDLGWSIIRCSSLRLDLPKESSLCHRLVARELPPVTPTDVIRVLETDFKDINEEKMKVSQDDILFINKLKEGIHKNVYGHYEIPLPFKGRPVLPSNKQLTVARLDHLKRRMSKDERYKEQYKEFMSEIIQRGDAEEVNNCGKKGETWYLPHHGVFHPKKSKRLQVVFDCSASVCEFLKLIANKNSHLYPLGSEFVLKNFYVDDGVTSVEDAEKAIKLASDAKNLDFASELPLERALGIQWQRDLDCFKFNVKLQQQPATCRGILSTVASVYDPLGFIAPVLLNGKRILQEICKRGTGWDDSLSRELQLRAVHIEMLPDMSTDSFINALWRFIAIRDRCLMSVSECLQCVSSSWMFDRGLVSGSSLRGLLPQDHYSPLDHLSSLHFTLTILSLHHPSERHYL